jgi:hypothetical protein
MQMIKTRYKKPVDRQNKKPEKMSSSIFSDQRITDEVFAASLVVCLRPNIYCAREK